MFSRTLNTIARRAYSQTAGGAKPTGPSTTTTSASTNADVPGLSSNCVKAASGPVGPGAATNAEYKVPEYFCFDRFSYAEAEVEMAKYRCPLPSALTK